MFKYLTIIVTALLSTGLAKAQSKAETMLLYCHGQTMAVDIRNIDSIQFNQEAMALTSLSIPYQIPIDSISFATSMDNPLRIGWWGDISQGESFFHHRINPDNIPQAELMSANDTCTSVAINSLTLPNNTPNKVGRKWRYVRNTLTGRKKVYLTSSFYFPYGESRINCTENGQYYQFELTPIFNTLESNTVCKVVNYWYHPTAISPLPPTPVFGSLTDNDSYSIVMNEQDSTLIYIYLNRDVNNDITGDSTIISYPNDSEAKAHYEMMDTDDDEYTTAFLCGNRIVVIEHFQATEEEVRRWLTRFDLELCKPLFIDEE
ncbi:MAG: hypothetical protein IKH88_01320 [Prevotella sp.]|nr:hypothetical protein [Prevotella sp.]